MLIKKKTPPNICELTPLSVNFQKRNATKSLLEKTFSIVFCKGMFEKKTPPNICELTPLSVNFQKKKKRHQLFVS